MEENKKEIYRAAEVIMLIIKNEGQMEYSLEDQSEFQPAYDKLLALDIIQFCDEWLVPGANFEKASRSGLEEFLRRKQLAEQRPSHRNKWLAGIAGGAVLAAIGYMLRQERN